ncbi:hypothetical protein ACP4OV_015713 [Aristida adscensionis]
MVSLQSALLPEAKRPPCLSPAATAVASTATSKKRKRDDDGAGVDGCRGAGEAAEDGIELNFDAAPLPPEWQRCLDIKSGQIHYYNTRTHKRTWKDPRAEPEYRAAAAATAEDDGDEEEDADAHRASGAGLDLELNLTFEPRRFLVREKKKPRPAAPPAADHRHAPPADHGDGGEMVAAVCMRCHMLVMMCRASPACPNCKFLHPPTSRGAPPPPPEPEPAPLKLGLQLLCCRD